MCGCRVPDAIAARPIHPKLGASLPPVVLVMTRPWYAGATATCADPDGSASTTTCVCCRRKAMSASKPAACTGVAGRLALPHAASWRQRPPTIVTRLLQPELVATSRHSTREQLSLEELHDCRFKLLLRHPAGPVQAHDALAIDEDVHRDRGNAERFVIRVGHRNRLMLQKAVEGVPYLRKVPEFPVGRDDTSRFDVAVTTGRRNDREAAPAV